MELAVNANKFQALQKNPQNPKLQAPPHKPLNISPWVTQIQNSESKGTEINLSSPHPNFCSWWTTRGHSSCSCSQLHSLWASALGETARWKASMGWWGCHLWGDVGCTGMGHMGMWSGCNPLSAVLLVGLHTGGIFLFSKWETNTQQWHWIV